MSAPTMDDAAKVLADPTAYADDVRLHTALTHLRANDPGGLGGQRALPPLLGDHQTRRHHGCRAGQRPVHQRATTAAGHRGGRRPRASNSSRPAWACAR